jgi:hypothetical protein
LAEHKNKERCYIKVIYTKRQQPILVDEDDYERLNNDCWCLNSVGYAVRTINGKQVPMHRIITSVPDGLYVDHINHDTKDNRKENLRVCTQSQNMRNARLKSNNRSGASGVYFNKQSQRWMARIKVNYKYIFLGLFKEKQDAIDARSMAEDKYFGEFKYREVILNA